MTGDDKVKKKRDPIFVVCLGIFLIAAIAVVGVYINDHYIAEDDTEAAYGDKVTVDYTGSYYDYVDGEFAVVFDTSYSSVAENDKIIKSNSFTKMDKQKFDSLSFTIGKGEVLAMFGDAIVGHKVGDKIQVYIPAGEGYPGTDKQMGLNDGSVEKSEIMTKANFDRMYPDVKLTTGKTVTFKTVYGWEATALSNSTNNSVVINHNPKVGETYDYAGNEDSQFGTVKFAVTDVDKEVSFNFIIDGKKVDDKGEIQMIDLDLGEVWHITNVANGSFTYHTGDENGNMPLYFEIKLVSIGA